VTALPGAFAVDDNSGGLVGYCSPNPPKTYAFRDISDGLSTTMLMSEVRQGPVNQDIRGLAWYAPFAGFTTYLGPNSSSPDFMSGFCTSSPHLAMPCVGQSPTALSSRSKHTGGVQSLMGDGSVRFISNNVNLPTWRAISTIQGAETIGDF